MRAKVALLLPRSVSGPSPWLRRREEGRGGLLELDARLALADLTNDEGPHAVVFQLPLYAVSVVGSDDDDKTDAHIEDLEHLGFLNVAQLLQPAEHGRNRPRSLLEEHPSSRRQDAR